MQTIPAEQLQAFLKEAKETGDLTKYSCVYKEKKQKGDVVDSWYKVTWTKTFTDEKEPERNVHVSYEG